MKTAFLSRSEAKEQAPWLGDIDAVAAVDGWTPFIITLSGVTERVWNRIVLQDPAALGLRAVGPLRVTLEERAETRTLSPGQETWFITVHDLPRITVTRKLPP